MSTLDNLKKEAKRWLKDLRADSAEARVRFDRAFPDAPVDPCLRDVQHALARERGHENWISLKGSVKQDQIAPQDVVATFLEFACWDNDVHGKSDHRMYDRAAQRLLTQHPAIARANLYTAIVSGEVETVKNFLAERPDAATEAGGPRNWAPILYLSYTRFTHQRTHDNAPAIAKLLLNHGADPNAFYMAYDSRYTALVGVAGEGEQDSPRQPQAEALFQLLLERGADPFDIQVLYNTHFSGDVLWWLKLIYEHSMKTVRKAEWADSNWSMLDMGGYGSGAQFLLSLAVKKNDFVLAEWCLSRGARPLPQQPRAAPRPASFRNVHTTSIDLDWLYRLASHEGFLEMANLLEGYGASTVKLANEGEEAFAGACFRLDREAARAQLEEHPEYLTSPTTMFDAAERDRADVVAFLLDLGVSIEVEDKHKQRALHAAAGKNALHVATLLIERGAEIDPIETNFGSPPIGWATHGNLREMVDLLSRHSRNIWALVFGGYVGRLREVLSTAPELAKKVDEQSGLTPLWWLPDDEVKALALVELLVSNGADPAARNKKGKTAADWARKRGMLEVAQLLDSEVNEHGK